MHPSDKTLLKEKLKNNANSLYLDLTKSLDYIKDTKDEANRRFESLIIRDDNSRRENQVIGFEFKPIPGLQPDSENAKNLANWFKSVANKFISIESLYKDVSQSFLIGDYKKTIDSFNGFDKNTINEYQNAESTKDKIKVDENAIKSIYEEHNKFKNDLKITLIPIVLLFTFGLCGVLLQFSLFFIKLSTTFDYVKPLIITLESLISIALILYSGHEFWIWWKNYFEDLCNSGVNKSIDRDIQI